MLNGDFPENRGLKWCNADVALVESFVLLLLLSIFGLVLLPAFLPSLSWKGIIPKLTEKHVTILP